MRIINNVYKSAIENFKEKYGKNDPEKSNKISRFCLIENVNEGVLMYNTVTGELVFTTDNDNIFNNWFHEHLFTLNEDVDELEMAIEYKKWLLSQRNKEFNVSSYTILTTTECNARCFYCYEKGHKQIPMSDKVAEDVANFMMKTTPFGTINISWFGGEPLYNQRPIDIIINKLKENGREYSCSMISNGYIFNKKTIEKAKNDWKLTQVQITIDGLEETYNKIKNYKSRPKNAFNRIIENIENLSNAGIKVLIRINVGIYNCEESVKLVKYLKEHFNNNPLITIYAHELFENYPNDINSAEKEEFLYKTLSSIDNELGVGNIPNNKKASHCMADNKNTLVILTDGRIGLCEHFIDTNTIGSIYEDEYDINKVHEFEKVRNPLKECFNCPLLIECLFLKMCDDTNTSCSENRKSYLINKRKIQIKSTYEKYKNANPVFLEEIEAESDKNNVKIIKDENRT